MINLLSLDEFLSLNIALTKHNSLIHLISLIFAQTFDFIPVFFFFLVISLFTKKRKHSIFLLLLTFTSGIGFILKILIHRPRPYFFGIIDYANSLSYSFPSGHSIVVFMLAAYYSKNKNFQTKTNLYGLAVLVALSRVVLGVHYLSDVIAGAIISILITKTYFWKEKEINKFFNYFFNKLKIL